MTRYGYYDTEVQPQAPIDELSTGGPLVTTQDPADYERPAAGDDVAPPNGDKDADPESPEHHRNAHSTKAGAKA